LKKIPRQQQEGGIGGASKAFESAASTSKAAMIGNFILNLSLSASLNQLWAMINTQQMIVMLPLMKVILP